MRILGAILASTLLAALTATSAAANCDPTAEPDKTDIANARAAVEAHCACATATSHGAYVSCAAQQANAVLVNKSCASAVKKCAGKSTCGRPGTVTCCRTTGRGRTSCSLKRSASRCAAPHGGQACVGSFASCCDACNVTGCVATTTTSTSTTSTSTTTTTLGPICGDDQINQSSEECDGTARGDCVVAPELACGAPGGTAPCQCCIPPGATHPIGAGGPQCCDGQPEPLGPGVVACPNTTGRCDPPSICPLGTCQADGSCCAAAGTACVFYYAPPVTYGASAACCSGLACRTVVPPAPGVLVQVDCCVADGKTCTADGECCTGHCTAGSCDQCRAPGATCASDSECCTPSCVGGVCGACFATDSVCTDGVQCCSGTCRTGPAGGIGTCQ